MALDRGRHILGGTYELGDIMRIFELSAIDTHDISLVAV
jgi:hypothetical protein